MIYRYGKPIKLISIGLILAAAIMLTQSLPMDQWLEQLGSHIDEMGVWGAIVYGLIYLIATVLLLPGSALTITSGLLFGLLWGTIVVSIGSTAGAAAAFLIGRHLARERVSRKINQYPKFAAIDRAVVAGGWRIVALLRLSPVVPFNLQNYLYGLTSIRLGTCVLTSWLTMLPGTFMYVYFGYLARQGAEAAAGSGDRPAKLALTVVGLIATIAVTLYITRIATRAVKQHTDIDTAVGEPDPRPAPVAVKVTGRPWQAMLIGLLAVAFVATAAYARLNTGTLNQLVANLFGPPPVQLAEAYAPRPTGPRFDHSVFDGLLRQHVDAHGWVDYAALARGPGPLDQYVAALAEAPFDELDRHEKLALLLNAYNAFTLRLILDYWDDGRLRSIKDIPDAARWKHRRWRVGHYTWSLNDIEHEQIRPEFVEPRIHFALVCAALSCPKLAAQAYQVNRLETQLNDQAIYVHQHQRWFVWDEDTTTVKLTLLYDWYRSDFEQVADTVLGYAARYHPRLQRLLDGGTKVHLRWLPYDWKLNSTHNRPDGVGQEQ